MAAIAKFISYDGGIAFSERVMKVQEADQEAVIISLDDVAAVRIRRPQDDAEGFIRVDTADGKHYRIYFEDDQLQEAVQFKRQFDATVSDGEEDRTLAPVPAPRQSKQSYVKSTQPYSGNPRRQARKPILKKWWFWAIIAILAIAIIAPQGGHDDKANEVAQNQTTPTPATAEPETSALPTAETERTSMETLCSLLEMTISDNFEHYKITYEDDTITVSIWQEGIAANVTAIQMAGGDANNSNWVYLKNSVRSMAESMCGLIDTAGRTDVYLYTSVQNDQNTDNTLLMYLDTALIYDCLA